MNSTEVLLQYGYFALAIGCFLEGETLLLLAGAAAHSGLLSFMYGLRLIGPIVIGMSEVQPMRFVMFNMLGAALWACAVTCVGYAFGHTLQWRLADIELFEKIALACVAVVVVALLTRRSV